MSLINIDQLRSYADHGLNVLMEGHAGVGKSSAILESFGGRKYKYFSAPTLDPWVDLVGAPRAVHSEKHGQEVLRLIRPEWVLDNDVEIIFFDELNRAPPKVLDAVMELIQFKSINGHKFEKLQAVWAAINPADESGDYKVEELDRALRDRFQVQLRIKYAVDEQYFLKKYPQHGQIFIDWWNLLPTDLKDKISPRRLDYIADAFYKGLPLGDFAPPEAPIAKLRKALKMQPFHELMFAVTNEDEAREFLKDGNNATKLLELCNVGDKAAIEFFKRYQHVMPKELTEALGARVTMVEKGTAPALSLAELLGHIKGAKAGEVKITEIINDAEFAIFHKNGGTLMQDMKTCIRTQPAGFPILVAHLKHLFTKGTADQMAKAMYKKPATKEDKTNITNCLMALAMVDTDQKVFDKETRKRINAHMYLHKVVASKWM